MKGSYRFNPRASRKRRATSDSRPVGRPFCRFNPRASRKRRATIDQQAAGACDGVSIHARPERDARPGSRCRSARRRRFNPRASRKRRATFLDLTNKPWRIVSIHARPERDARLVRISSLHSAPLFQSTRVPKETRDCRRLEVLQGAGLVSIHARPERDARHPGNAPPLSDISFQSTRVPKETRDASSAVPRADSVQFQSTRVPKETRDGKADAILLDHSGFNPRASRKRRATVAALRLAPCRCVSIHARPERDARPLVPLPPHPPMPVSIHARPERDARLDFVQRRQQLDEFQSTRVPKETRDVLAHDSARRVL